MITGRGLLRVHHDEEEVTVMLVDDYISIGRTNNGVAQIMKWQVLELQASYERNRKTTIIRNNREPSLFLEIEGKEALDFVDQAKNMAQKPWYRRSKNKSSIRLVSFLMGTLLVIACLYFLIIPWVASKMANVVSINTEEKIGQSVFESMIKESDVDPTATKLINAFFDTMNVHSLYDIRISVVKGYEVNAFALPGGNIVVYTGLLDKLTAYPQLAALLSHEFIHVDNRHATSTVFRQMGSRIFISLVTGNANSTAGVIADQADRLRNLKYSRTKEQEADDEGLQILENRNIPTSGFIELFQMLKKTQKGNKVPQILSSHPDLDSRMKSILSKSGKKSSVENPALKSIFDQIKNN